MVVHIHISEVVKAVGGFGNNGQPVECGIAGPVAWGDQ